jgi:hypothetical protein
MGMKEHMGRGAVTLVIRSSAMLFGLFAVTWIAAQDIPSKPLSIPVYHPMVINPAFVGSKDFTNISLTSKVLKYPDSQLLNLHKRLTKSNGDFSNVGIGAYAFQEQLDRSWNSGLALAGSYHWAIDDAHVHNIALGASLKGFFAVPKKDIDAGLDSSKAVFQPDMDLGVYYYGPQGFAGLSVTTLFDSRNITDSITSSYSQLDREYHLYGGYKFILSKSVGIVLEPSLLVSLNDSTIFEPHRHLIPYLKIYLQNFYLGTYLKDFDTFALFFQYQFPRFYTGVFLEFPRVGYLNDENIIFEVSLGVNLGKEGASFLKYRHW